MKQEINVFDLYQALFVTAKLSGFIDYNWFVVCTPYLIEIAIEIFKYYRLK